MAQQERSAGFVIYYQDASATGAAEGVEFLLLDYGRHWDFVKGHVEAGEDDMATALRELKEETGLSSPRPVSGFQREVTYFFRHKRHGLVRKTVIFFLARVDTRKVVISHEHAGFGFFPFDKAIKRLTFPTAKEILTAAWECLQS
ncbi:MAG TPA: NUDIX domain-containing protein [Tepidisphaeraceae bacterium]|jgi:8-oxo-dGTP pyrophosphatase MutT (NUDIX family)|nr:NUDIX domain-containing protein [Tepidisphaeraceae bacterium]